MRRQTTAPHLTPKERNQVRYQTVTLIRRGELVKPDRCAHCGKRQRSGNYLSKIQVHHVDYIDPRNVLWLCLACHWDEHTRLSPATAAAMLKAERQMAREAERYRKWRAGWRERKRIMDRVNLRAHVRKRHTVETKLLEGDRWKTQHLF